jgi:exodeoxyribonuclease V gamma subunit
VTVSRIAALEGDPESRRQAALEQLTGLLDLYDRGMREPLPLACDTSAAYVEAVLPGGDREAGEAAAKAAWETVFRYDKEDRQPEHVLVYGEAIPFGALLARTPREDESWEEGEETRFGRYAMRLWRALLAAEELSDQ